MDMVVLAFPGICCTGLEVNVVGKAREWELYVCQQVESLVHTQLLPHSNGTFPPSHMAGIIIMSKHA